MGIDSLVQKLTAAREAYYAGGSPIMSDAEFDVLEEKLRAIDPNHDFFTKVGAPPVDGAWPKVAHGAPMGSLNKAQVSADLAKWWKGCEPSAVLISEKLDGISISIRYQSGRFVQALTRGDGEIGEDITRNVNLMKGLVKKVSFTSEEYPWIASFTGYIRGEILCLRSNHQKHFPGESNPRNTASGTSKRQSGGGQEHLTILSYQLLSDEELLTSKSEEFELLEKMGAIVPNRSPAADLGGVEEVYQKYIDSVRDSLDYDIDGLVIEVDDLTEFLGLGMLNKRPRGAVAFKFPHESAQTTLQNITWQVGKSGRVTPVAEFATVDLVGANVSRASLHNLSNIRTVWEGQTTRQGDTILVSRRNDVIPYVEAFITAGDGPDLIVPDSCPVCGESLAMDGEYLVCNNEESCPARKVGQIKRWLEKVGVLEWGDTVVHAVCDQLDVNTPADLYGLEE
ncbi:MAG: DNA ligase (NAD(+)) LigA, partial [Proteobacteria bacterium]|nr:DNA ligase (NAD(+)) LigA [Pseudomonadota bacterium]